MEQSPAARAVFSENQQSVKEVLEQFAQFFKQDGSLFIWGNGAAFDPPILESLYYSFGMIPPWHFSNVNDVRTIKRFQGSNTKIINLGTAHNALDDSISQAKYVMEKIRNK